MVVALSRGVACRIVRLLTWRGPIILLLLALSQPYREVAASTVPPDAGLAYFQSGRFAEALQSWSESAQSGDARAALYLGVLYDTGFGVPQDLRQALDWYLRAASAGNVTAMFNVAVMNDGGRGVERNANSALDWYARAAAKGSGRAAYNLGLIYEQGVGVAADRGQAIRYFKAASSLGIAAAGSHLSRLGVPVARAVEQPAWRPAERQEDPAMLAFQQAQRMLLSRGVAEAAQAVAMLRRAADEGSALAEYDLGYCYEHGIGVPVDLPQAIMWYRRAAAHAVPGGIRVLAETSARNLSGGAEHAGR